MLRATIGEAVDPDNAENRSQGAEARRPIYSASVRPRVREHLGRLRQQSIRGRRLRLRCCALLIEKLEAEDLFVNRGASELLLMALSRHPASRWV
jgi:hypothetical protein